MNPARIRAVNLRPVRPERAYVLYWSIAARRTSANHALDRAIAVAKELGRGLIVLEPLRIGYPWASVRLHTFVQQGMADNHARYAAAGIRHHAYVEPRPGHGKGLLEALGARACAVVTDDFPAFFLPRMVAAAGDRLDVRLEAVDSNGLVPLAAPQKEYGRAFDLRRALGSLLDPEAPAADPLAGLRLPAVEVPAAVAERWPAVTVDPRDLAIDPLAPAPYPGGERAARAALGAFVARIDRYADHRNHPDHHASSGLSPWLHFGHLSPQTVVDAVRAAAPGDVGPFAVDASAAAFLDELVTWRELSYHTARARPGYDGYDALPAWALESLAGHEADRREAIYDVETLAAAATGDPIWNAAQRQLVGEGRIHNYLRMLWGKRVIGWTRTPREAFDILVELNNRYAVDGRDPCSWSGIAWCFGRYDRPWPSRPIYGVVRYMSSASTRKKVRMTDYLARWGP